MKKILAAATTIALGILVTGSAVRAKPVEIRVWSEWAAGTLNGDIFLKYVNEFNQLHQSIKVVAETGGTQDLLVAYAGGAAPDMIVGRGPMAFELGGPDGILLPLDPFIDGPKGFSRDAFVRDLWSFTTVQGKVYMLAADSNERALFVNQDAAERAGLDIAQGAKDWNVLLTWAKRLTYRVGDEVKSWGFNANHQFGGDRWHWIWLNDGEIFAANKQQSALTNPNTVEAVQFAADLIHKYGVSPVPGSVTGSNRANFRQGKYNMIIDTCLFVAELERDKPFNYLTFPGPPGVGKTGGRFSGASGSTLAIVRSTQYPNEAWEFVRFLMYERGAQFAEDRAGIPYLAEALKTRKFTMQPWLAFARSIMSYLPKNAYGVPVYENVWNSLFQTAWTSVMKGEASAKTALAQAADAINAAIAQEQAKMK